MVETQRIDGKACADRLVGRIAAVAADLKAESGVVAGLCAVLVGDDPASQIYVRSKGKAAIAAGIESFTESLPASTSEADLLALIDRLNGDHRVDGILVQLPLPKHIDPQRVIAAVSPAKDVDGFHPQNVGHLWSGDHAKAHIPCTPYGCLILLRETRPDLAGAEAVVIGRSNIVGKPMAALLLNENCTVTVVHSKSRDLPALVRRADVLVAAIGRPDFVRGDWIKPGAVVIDVGINRIAGPEGKSKIVGDVAFAEAQGIAGAITPVPGGVGPMTIACLLRNTIIAAHRRRGLAEPAL
jgi:methylenetetrahydrofolate dehydrogenase (NADP+)/methenyltetrahydrofolate cyclohydrolase